MTQHTFYMKRVSNTYSVFMHRELLPDIRLKYFPIGDDEDFARLLAEELTDHLNAY